MRRQGSGWGKRFPVGVFVKHLATSDGRYVNGNWCSVESAFYAEDTTLPNSRRVWGASPDELAAKGAKVYGTEKAATYGETAYHAAREQEVSSWVLRRALGLSTVSKAF